MKRNNKLRLQDPPSQSCLTAVSPHLQLEALGRRKEQLQDRWRRSIRTVHWSALNGAETTINQVTQRTSTALLGDLFTLFNVTLSAYVHFESPAIPLQILLRCHCMSYIVLVNSELID